ncbi:hypothetical protein VNO78_11328 [Psophocarpus tetragonolobus]|uniref:Uncharacterized protein n=1 Tax=Psophocarpus tetragonolobus TaxID=3891 RepID=A0AAN9SM78_PSOTE
MQMLLLYGDGQKHIAKAIAFHDQQPVQAEKSTTDAKVVMGTAPNDETKLQALEDDLIKKSRNDSSVDMGNGEVIQGEEAAGSAI